MSLLPLMLTAITLSNHGKLERWSITWERGEFLLISATLLIAALGEMVASGNHMIKTKICVTTIVLLMAIGLCSWYGSIVESMIMKEEYALDAVIYYSPRVFAFSLLASLACVMLSGPKYENS